MHFRQWLAHKILPQAKRAHVWAAMVLIDDPKAVLGDEGNLLIVPDGLRAVARQIIERELDEILFTARVASYNWETERSIIEKRLARRYDPGMALNESFERAGKKVEEEKPIHPVSGEPVFYTDKQAAALKFQEEFLRRNAQRG